MASVSFSWNNHFGTLRSPEVQGPWGHHMERAYATRGRDSAPATAVGGFPAQVLDTAVNVPAPRRHLTATMWGTLWHSPPWDWQVPVYLWANKWLVSFYDLGWHIRGEKNPEHIIFSTAIFTNNEVWSPLFFSFLAPPCGVWDPSSGTEPMPSAVIAWSLNTGLLGKFLICSYLASFSYLSVGFKLRRENLFNGLLKLQRYQPNIRIFLVH